MATSQQTGGELAAAIRSIRRLTDEPAIRAKYTDDVLMDLLNEAWQEVVHDLYAQADTPPWASFDVATVADQINYVLPASVGEIQRIKILDSSNELISEIIPSSHLNPFGYGIRFEGTQRFALEPTMLAGHTIRIEYIPSGDIVMHSGQVGFDDCTSTVLTLPVPNDTDDDVKVLSGSVDARPNAYLGAYLGLIGITSEPGPYPRFPIQQRIVASSSALDGTLTVSPAFDFDPSEVFQSGHIQYEVYPMEAPVVWPVLTKHVARSIAGFENKKERFKLLTQLYAEAKRACCLKWANMETRAGDSMDARTIDNEEYMAGIY